MKSTIPFISFLVVTLVGYVSAAAVKSLPPSIEACTKGPQFDPCAEKTIEKALAVLVDGYAPLGIHSIDPLEIIAIDVEQGSGPVSINLKFRNLKINGLSQARLSDFKSDLDNLKFVAKVTMPKVQLNGLYTIDGKVLILPIKGDGTANITLDGVTGDLVLTGKHFQKDKVTYMKVTRFGFNLDCKKLKINLTNLFNGDKVLGDNMNRFLNENSAEIFHELKAAFQEAFGVAFAEVSNRIFTKVPFDKVVLS